MERSAVLLTIVLCIGMIGGGVVPGSVAGDEPTGADIVHECAATPPEDFADPETGNETIGWFDGFWYNEPIAINVSEGITPEELANLSARTAARIEAMRCLPFKYLPQVEIIDRATFANETEGQFANVSEEHRLFDNAQFEAMLLIGSEEDSIEVRQADREVTTGGYYNFIEERIVVISDDPDNLLIDEEVLAHELGHALQDQHFNLERYVRDTKDLDRGKLGVIEGDIHRIEHKYLNHCEADRWEEPCVIEDPEGPTEDPGEPPNWGLYFMEFQPYSDGQDFVNYKYELGGWDRVNALYEEMPMSARQVIYPEQFSIFEEANLTVSDESSDDWERVSFPRGPEYNVIGMAGMGGMFIDPAYDDGDPTTGPIVTAFEFLNIVDLTTGEIDPTNPINFDLGPTDGWIGDRLYVYKNGHDTATVWKTAWENRSQQEEFRTAYETLITYRRGEPVEGYAHTWTFGEDTDFDMAVTLVSDDDRLMIVTAPTIDELTDIHDIELVVDPIDDQDDELPIDDDDLPQLDDQDFPDDSDAEVFESEDEIPGFGLIGAILSVILAIRLIGHRSDKRRP